MTNNRLVIRYKFDTFNPQFNGKNNEPNKFLFRILKKLFPFIMWKIGDFSFLCTLARNRLD